MGSSHEVEMDGAGLPSLPSLRQHLECLPVNVLKMYSSQVKLRRSRLKVARGISSAPLPFEQEGKKKVLRQS